ncbi:hypothetical protein CLOP_g11856 [Closterium sp. NIES-67]|nr:hypothetical protein CLOP_g11856 [Closterium sp. NIES-67]
MARSRKSRKGKKEWRRNISTADHDKFLEAKGREERSGGLLDAVPSENIFFVDKSKVAPKERKVDKWRARESHADAILKRSSLVPPLAAPAHAKSAANPAGKPADKLADKAAGKPAVEVSVTPPAAAAGDGGGEGGAGGGSADDASGRNVIAAASGADASAGLSGGGETAVALTSGADSDKTKAVVAAVGPGIAGGNRRAKKARKSSQKPLFDLWAEEDLAGNPRTAGKGKAEGGGGQVVERVRRRGDGKMIGGKEDLNKPGAAIPAVEIDAPGCSFNPSIEEHQDAIAVAVADELKESYQAALAPTPPQLLVTRAEEEEARMQEAADFFLTQAEEDDEEEEEEEEGEDGDGNTAAATKHKVPRRLTKADLNRRMRHRLVEAELEKRRKLKRMRKDLDRLKDLKREMEEEREEAEKRRVRREIARLEFRMKRAPRLGRHKFKPEPMNVLTSDQVTGSLRQLKGSFTLVRDRFKSFQKRGMIETHGPTIKQSLSRKRRVVEQGSQGRGRGRCMPRFKRCEQQAGDEEGCCKRGHGIE